MRNHQLAALLVGLSLFGPMAYAEVSVAVNDPMSECINSDGEWDPSRKEGHRCVCTGDRIHASVGGVVCEDKCVARPKKAIAAPVDPPPAAQKSADVAPPPAAEKTAAPAGDTFCRGWIKRTDAINRVQNWNDDLACACAISCRSVGKLGKNPLAKFNPNGENGIFCESLDPEHYDSGPCGLTPKSGMPGLAGMSGTRGEDGKTGAPGIACWDTNRNGSFDPDTEDTDHDGDASVSDCRGADGKAGDKGQDGASVTPEQRCHDTGGTWLTTADPPGCVCSVGYHANGPACVVNVQKSIFDRFHLLGGVYLSGSWGVYKPVAVPAAAGPMIGVAVDLTNWLQLESRGGALFAGDAQNPAGSFVAGGFRWWPWRNFGFTTGTHGHFIGTNAALRNRYVDVGGQVGIIVQIPAKYVKVQLGAELLLGEALPASTFTAGYITQLNVNWR